MRKLKFRFLAVMLCVCVMLMYLTPSVFAASDTEAPNKIRKVSKRIVGEYIVVLKESIGKPNIVTLADELVSTHGKGGKIINYYKHALKGFSVKLSEKEAIALSNDPNVDYIEENGEVHTAAQYNPPWGLDRIDQLDRPLDGYFENNGYTGAGAHAYIIDTGILPTHQEFGGRASIAADFIGDGQNGNDCNGHGTHVAGTIGGTTYGVAKGVSLHAVRVLNCQGSGSYESVIAGVDWVTGNHVPPAVANMSLSGSASDTMDTAVINSINSGVTYVVAAGNSYGADASNYSPARISQAITVGATDSTDNRASFSNIGSVLDIFAPGVSVTSAWIGSNTATNTISGTSMATPHVTGVAALYLQYQPQAQTLDVNNAIVGSATVNRIVNPGQNSPNLLLKTMEDDKFIAVGSIVQYPWITNLGFSALGFSGLVTQTVASSAGHSSNPAVDFHAVGTITPGFSISHSLYSSAPRNSFSFWYKIPYVASSNIEVFWYDETGYWWEDDEGTQIWEQYPHYGNLIADNTWRQFSVNTFSNYIRIQRTTYTPTSLYVDFHDYFDSFVSTCPSYVSTCY